MGNGMCRAAHVLGILPPAMAQGLLQEIKVKYREADKGQIFLFLEETFNICLAINWLARQASMAQPG